MSRSKMPYSCPSCGTPYGPRPAGEKGPYPYCERCKAESDERMRQWNHDYNVINRKSHAKPPMRTLTCKDCGDRWDAPRTTGPGPSRCQVCLPVFALLRNGKRRVQQKQVRDANPNRVWAGQLAMKLRKFGLTVERYLAVERCECCGAAEPGGKGAWHLDHDHSCCRGCPSCFRGFLCHACNTGLGTFKDDPEWLRKAADWVETKRTEMAA